MPQVLNWLQTAQACFSDDAGSLQRGLLTSVFGLITGLARIFHLEDMNDVGFAMLTGGRRCPSRHLVGAWRRHLPWYEVDAFCRRTFPWHLIEAQEALVSYDEHTLPRWTRKFHISKGYITTRNKYMRCEKLFYSYECRQDRYLALRATPGNWELRDLAVPSIKQVLRYGQPKSLHALFDAGASKADANVRALWDLANAEANLNVTVRACRHPHRVRRWKQSPRDLFTSYEEPGVCVGAPAKEIRLAETETILKGEAAEQAVRTIVCREIAPGPKKDRWHPLFTTMPSTAEPAEVLTDFRLRQHHEQAYRVGKHDEFMDAIPCGYNKDSPDRMRPGFQRGPLQMIGWLAALVYNAAADFAENLAGDYVGSHVSTLQRKFLNRPGRVYCTPEALIVYLDPFAEQEALLPMIDQVNAERHRLPWLDDRRLVVSTTPRANARNGP
jgi:hypothetical protein